MQGYHCFLLLSPHDSQSSCVRRSTVIIPVNGVVFHRLESKEKIRVSIRYPEGPLRTDSAISTRYKRLLSLKVMSYNKTSNVVVSHVPVRVFFGRGLGDQAQARGLCAGDKSVQGPRRPLQERTSHPCASSSINLVALKAT